MNEAQSALLLGMALGFLVRSIREHMRVGSAIKQLEAMRKNVESWLSETKNAVVLWPGGSIKLRDDNGRIVAKLVNTNGKVSWMTCDDE